MACRTNRRNSYVREIQMKIMEVHQRFPCHYCSEVTVTWVLT